MITHKTLYSRDSNGGTRIWYVEQEESAYRQSYGLLDGKLVQTGWVYCDGKNVGRTNETTSVEQVEKEISSLYLKQLKAGYFESVKDIDKELYVSPMLAKKFEDRKGKLKYPLYLQLKYNGSRCVATRSGLFSRKGERFISAPHIEGSLIDFFQKYPDAVLDGELMGDGMKTRLNETMKLIRKTVHISDDDLLKSKELVKYHVYDGYNFDGLTKESPYSERVKTIAKNLTGNPYYKEVNTIVCNNEEEVYKHFNKLIENQEEGAIIRVPDSPYENKRSSNLLKLKSEDDSEAVILDITEGVGDWAGTGKRITLNWNGKIFDATFKGTYEEGVEFLKNKKQWIGKKVTFLYMGLTGLGIPNYARVDYNNCVKE